jgi:hypothetical protein
VFLDWSRARPLAQILGQRRFEQTFDRTDVGRHGVALGLDNVSLGPEVFWRNDLRKIVPPVSVLMRPADHEGKACERRFKTT